MIDAEFVGGAVLGRDGLEDRSLRICEGVIEEGGAARQIDVAGFRLLPGIVDLHGDGFEKHVAPRRGAMKDMGGGILAAEAEIAANGITTAVMAQFVSWEGGLRDEAFADTFFMALQDVAPITHLIPQLRFETNLLDLYEGLPEKIARWAVPYVVFNDHLPHARLAKGQRPKSLTGQALKAGRNPEKHYEFLLRLHAGRAAVPAALDALCPKLAAMGVCMGSHDDNTAAQRNIWLARGVQIAEFPETLEAAEEEGDVILGAPNVVRGGSHKGNVSALDLVLMGQGDALASDYHYPSPRRAGLFLAKTIGLPAAWALLSEGPARVLGLQDRGRLEPGLRADVVFLDAEDRVAGTLSGGRFSFLRGDLAERLLA